MNDTFRKCVTPHGCVMNLKSFIYMENMILLIARKSSDFAYANRAVSHMQIERFRTPKSSVLHIDIRSCFRLDVKLSLMLFYGLRFVNIFSNFSPKNAPLFLALTPHSWFYVLSIIFKKGVFLYQNWVFLCLFVVILELFSVFLLHF